jgi:hypothetical protein
MTVIEKLQQAIEELHNVQATHRESVRVKETWKGKTIWDGVVEVFHIKGHQETETAYAWLHDTGDSEHPLPVTVLHIDPALSPAKAVRAFIVQEYASGE